MVGEDRRTLTVSTLHFVGPQLINGLTDPYGFGCLVYVFWVYVKIEQGEQAHDYVHDDQPACHTTYDGIHLVTPIVVADEWSI